MGNLRGDCFDYVDSCGKNPKVKGIIPWVWVLDYPREKGREKEEEGVFTTDSFVVWSKRQWPQVKDT